MQLIRMNTLFFALIILTLGASSYAEQTREFGPYTVHYSVVNTTFLSPQVASAYGITRGKKRAIVNIAVRAHGPEGSDRAKAARVTGRSWDLMKNQDISFREISEQNAIYYIAEVSFINEEFRWFEISVVTDPNKPAYIFKFKKQLYVDS